MTHPYAEWLYSYSPTLKSPRPWSRCRMYWRVEKWDFDSLWYFLILISWPFFQCTVSPAQWLFCKTLVRRNICTRKRHTNLEINTAILILVAVGTHLCSLCSIEWPWAFHTYRVEFWGQRPHCWVNNGVMIQPQVLRSTNLFVMSCYFSKKYKKTLPVFNDTSQLQTFKEGPVFDK